MCMIHVWIHATCLCRLAARAYLTVHNGFGHFHDDGIAYSAHIQNSVLCQPLEELILHLHAHTWFDYISLCMAMLSMKHFATARMYMSLSTRH